MMKPGDRLLEIAQRLDELSEEMPELASLSEEIGLAAEQAFRVKPPQESSGALEAMLLRRLNEINQIASRAVQEAGYTNNLTFRLDEQGFRREALMAMHAAANPSGFKFTPDMFTP